MSGGATPQSGSAGGSLAAVAPILSAIMKQPQGAQSAPMQHPMMPGQAQPMAPMPTPPMSGGPVGAGLLGGMGGAGAMPPQNQQAPLQQMLMQRGLLGGMGGGGLY